MIRLPRMQRMERKPHPAEIHARAVFEGEQEMQEKVRRIFETFRRGDWKRVDKNTAWQMIDRHITNSDVEELRRAIRYAEVLPDPRATLGQILLYKTVGSEEHAKILRELIENTPKENAQHHVGITMFTHQMVNKIPEVGLGAVLERLAQWYEYREDILEKLNEIRMKSTWREEIKALEEITERKIEEIDELEKKGASKEFAQEIQEFVRWQEGEQGKEGAGKDALIWERKGKRETRWPR